MTDQERDVQRKLKVLRHAEQTGNIAKTCRYFGVGRVSFYRWKTEYQQRGEAGLVNAKPIPKNRPIRLRQKSWRKSFICEPNTTSDQSALFGI